MIASPGNAGVGVRPNEEQIYLEKLRNLQKYVEPLRKMIARIEQDDRLVGFAIITIVIPIFIIISFFH